MRTMLDEAMLDEEYRVVNMDTIQELLDEAYCIVNMRHLRIRVAHLQRVFRASVNMIIVNKRYVHDYYKPGGKGAKMAEIEFKAMA
jgi:hypothetical protein